MKRRNSIKVTSPGSAVRWDFQNKEIKGNPDASALPERDYRGRYKHP